jgi:hypothetical protein
MNHISKLRLTLEKLEQHIPDWQKTNTTVSAASIGWHIQHAALVTTRIIDTIKSSDPSNYKWKFNLARSLVFLINKIPRGKGKAPGSVLPTDISTESLRQSLNTAKVALEDLSGLRPEHHFDHPYFGKVSLKPSARFLYLHAEHHRKIIEDILNKKGA